MNEPEAATIDVVIQDLAYGGEGVGRVDGKAVFVPWVIPGETVRIRVVEDKPRFARARLCEVLVPSPDRVAPVCPHFGRCGGCHYQHLRYERQLAEKEKQLRGLLQRVGKLKDVPLITVHPSPEPLGYRNRIRVHHDPRGTGFYRADSRDLVDVEHCPIAAAAVNGKLQAFRAEPHEPGDYELRAPGLAADGFAQVNQYMTETLVDVVDARLDGCGGRLFEGYAGNGFLTRRIAGRFEHTLAVELDPAAARQAHTLKLANVEFLCCDALAAFRRAGQPVDAVVVDPPREGLPGEFIERLAASRARRLVYVSCDPGTLARDAGKLVAGGWTLTGLSLLDMFPQTLHLETVATFGR